MGKTLRVKRIAEMVEKINCSKNPRNPNYVNVSIHGPDVSVQHIMKLMESCRQDPMDTYPQLIHFNVAQDVSCLHN